ncbi:exopolysaccharide biosynthesis protein [Qipengyuania sp. JC766]|uniref:exopolysaccharide biosynthesis protein n=1 Tax=Qipengyuania sp. JC766 TaxID=3232139 RepID=UPI00345A417A
MDHDPENLEDVLEGLEHLAETRDRVSVADVLDEFGSRSYGPFLVLLPLIELSPAGAIPGVPTVIAAIIALIAVQIALGKDHVWLPQFVQKRTVKSDTITAITDKADRYAERIDTVFHKRLEWLTGRFSVRMQALAIIVLCAMVPPLEVIPFASSAPMMAIAAFGLAMLVRDGLLTVLAGALATGSIAVLAYSLMGGGG